MPRYATGKRAVGICARSGRKMLLKDMVKDERLGLMMDPAEADIKHPVEKPVKLDDAITLKRPAPNTENDSAGDGGSFLTALGLNSDPHFGSA